MRYKFYDLVDYQEGQSKIAKVAWQKGSYDHLLARTEERKCKQLNCNNVFQVKHYSPRQFCSHGCSATHSNTLRRHSEEVRNKISEALLGRPNPHKGKLITPRFNRNCLNCDKEFITPRWQNHKYCGVACSIHDIGSRPTSPKAARARSGVRIDISPDLYFFSRWEANFARVLNFLKIEWVFQPKTFDLKFQKYTPDFYLPNYNNYIEIKNFLSEYSLKRDRGFRLLYPKEKLTLILKEDYLKLQEQFSPHIKNWEFS